VLGAAVEQTFPALKEFLFRSAAGLQTLFTIFCRPDAG
jgi:hypothetical protein